ncbi:peptidylprolyl isomerase [Zhaonella formicivorans]|uniref:peptidylprolyl isomerase n=1 Tax=Zhaonella formicivorans TaxID=2528593 RepID=UPI0010F0F866|nr:peptidylprolyl isomerase [Zhaonella formicivorans]
MRKLRNLWKVCAILVVVIFVLAGCGKKKDVVATVNGQDITRQEFNEKMEGAKAAMELQGMKFDGEQGKVILKMLEQEVLNQMIQEAVITQDAEKQGIKVEPKKAKEQLDQMKKAYGEEAFKKMLEAQKTNEEKLTKYILFGLTADELYKKVTADVKVTEEEAKDYFAKNKEDLVQVKVSHILVEAKEGEATPEQVKKAEAKAKELIARLQDGADFAELAKKESDEPMAKTTGGALEGYFSKSDSMYVPEFTEGALKIAKGTVGAEPVKSPFGFHVIKVEDRKDTFEQLKEDLIAKLTADKKGQKWQEYLSELMKKAKIENKLEEEAKKTEATQGNIDKKKE